MCIKIYYLFISFSGDSNLYTILMLDVSGDEPDFTRASPSEPWLQWMITNVRGMDLRTGDTILDFFDAPVSAPYVFLLFKQGRGFVNIQRGDYDMLDGCPIAVG